MVSDLTSAYAECERMAREHYENFPVASLLMPRAVRPHVAAVYAFARAADDFADEGSVAAARRIELLDGWEARLHDAAAGRDAAPRRAEEPAGAIQIFQALRNTIADKRLPVSLFEDLLSAFRQDVTVCRYATWTDVLDYCRRSANPVGRLVLRIAGHRDDRFDGWSDAICSALQLTNFWQDLSIDTRRGRLYLPEDTLRAHGADSRAIESMDRLSSAWRDALADAVSRTRQLFEMGRPLCDAVTGRLRYELRAVWLGGTRILDRLHAADYDPFVHRPTLGAGDAPWLVWRFCAWRPPSPRLRRPSSRPPGIRRPSSAR
jgi:phytoene synthase